MARVAKDPQLKQYTGEEGLVARWLEEAKHVEESNEQQSFERHGERIQRKYKNAIQVANFDPARMPKVEYNSLWANVEVLEPCLYARIPCVLKFSPEGNPTYTASN